MQLYLEQWPLSCIMHKHKRIKYPPFLLFFFSLWVGNTDAPLSISKLIC